MSHKKQYETAEECGSNAGCRIVISALTMAFILFTSSAMATGEEGKSSMRNSSVGIAVPVISTHGVIDLSKVESGATTTVMSLAYSPNGSYLAIVEAVGPAATYITIWNLKSNKLQAQTGRLQQDFAIYPNAVLSWTPDSKYITFGFGGERHPIQLWDPMTGLLAKELPAGVVAVSLRFNGRGTEALASPGGAGSSKFRIYDTATWSYQEFDEGGMAVQDLAWAPNDQVLAVGYWREKAVEAHGAVQPNSNGVEQTIKLNDLIARVIDPTGRVENRTKVLIPSVPKTIQSGDKQVTYNQSQEQSPLFLVSGAEGDVVAVGLGNILYGKTLAMLTYATSDDIKAHRVPFAMQPRNVAISTDGNYLYLKGDLSNDASLEAKNLVLDTRNGKPLLWFEGGTGGIAVRPDGKEIAVGDTQSVKLFNVD